MRINRSRDFPVVELGSNITTLTKYDYCPVIKK